VPYHWGRYRGLAQDLKRRCWRNLVEERLLRYLRLPSAGDRLAPEGDSRRQHPLRIGNGGRRSGVDPQTGFHFDDTKRYLDAVALPPGDRQRIFEGNARRVFPRSTRYCRCAGGWRREDDRPPFRADHVGSLLRPPELKAARERFATGEITAAQLRAVEDAAIREAVAMQERLGLQGITDGEFRRGSGTWTSCTGWAA